MKRFRFAAGLAIGVAAIFLMGQAAIQTFPPNTVFGRIGVGQYGPGSPIPISSIASLLGIGVPAHNVAVGTGSTSPSFTGVAPSTPGQIFIDQGGGLDPAFRPMTGSCTIDLNGVISCSNLGGGTRSVVSATDTILTTDCFKTIFVTFNSGVAMETLPAASGFTTGCPIWLVNTGTRGVGLPGAWPAILTGHVLYPGQSMLIQAGTSAWVGVSLPGRWHKGGVNTFVDNVNGCANTSTCTGLYADGLANGIGAFASIAQAMLFNYQAIDHENGSPTINLTAGQSYTECITAQGQLTGINVGFIGGNGGNANWSCNGVGGNAAFLIGDNAEWETQNITFSCGAANSFGVYIHQPAVVDLLPGTNFGACSGTGAMIGSDHGGFINFDYGGGNMAIGPGNIGTFISLGQGTQITGSFTAQLIGSPTVGTFLTIAGSGTNFSLGGLATSGGLGSATIPYNCNGLSEISLNGGTLPGAGTPINTGSHCYVH
jgi:hypothetical protein